jgi:hypothetical protein
VISAQRGHDAFAIPSTRDVLSTNGNSNTAVIFDGFTGRPARPSPLARSPTRSLMTC